AFEQRLHQPARKTRKSPLTLLPRTTSVGPWPAADAASLPSGTSELRSPDTEPASTSRFVPVSTPTSMSPETLCRVTRPSRTDSRRTSPDTVFASTEPPMERTVASPDTDVSLRSPPTRSIRTSPLTVLTVASRSTSPESARSPDATSTSPAGTDRSSSIGPGVWNRCSAISDRPEGGGGPEAPGHGEGEPVGGGETCVRRGLLDRVAQGLGEAHRERRFRQAGGIVVDPVGVALERGEHAGSFQLRP